MAIPNFAKPGGAAPIMGQDTLSSGSGTVAPQMRGIGGFPVMNQLPGSGGAKPAQQKPQQQPGWNPSDWLGRLSNRSRPNVQGGAQDMASRILPSFNNGNPAGANNMRRSPYQSEQQIRELGANMGADDNWINSQISRLQGQQGGGQYTTMPVYNTQDVRNRAIGIGRGHVIGDPNYFGGQAPDATWQMGMPPSMRSTDANQRMIDYFSNQLRQGDPRNPLNTQGTGYRPQGQGSYQDYLNSWESGAGSLDRQARLDRYQPLSEEDWNRQQGGGTAPPEYDPDDPFWQWNNSQIRDARMRSPEEAAQQLQASWQEWNRLQGNGVSPRGPVDPRYWQGDANYFGGQAPGVGRYRPPTMDRGGNWQDRNGYNYNLPNAFGSYPGYGQGDPSSGSRGPGYDSLYGGGQNPQFQQMLQQLMMYLQGGGRGG